MLQYVDRAAILAALQSSAQAAMRPVTLPGIGVCYKRQLTAGDVLDADEIRDHLKASGLVVDRKVNMAIGLSQVLCDEAGAQILDPKDPAHIKLLINQPWAVLRAAVGADEAALPQEGADPNG